MEANPSKFQFMLMKSLTSTEVISAYIEIADIHIKCEKNIKYHCITIGDKQVDIICKNAARQIIVMYRFKGIFDIQEREITYNTFIFANFNYC